MHHALRFALIASAAALCTGSAQARDASAQYALHCMGCHLADGGGTKGKVPALEGFVGNFLRVPGGREFLVQVPGSASSLASDASLAAVLNWMLVTFSPDETPTDFVPYTAEEIGRIRSPLTDVGGTRARLLAEIEALDRH